MAKYTDEQIKKALECCVNGCNIKCPFFNTDCLGEDRLDRYVLDLINRQEAEIERLKQSYLDYEETSGLKWARAEAVKKFAEMVKAEMYTVGFDIDNLVAEMVGEGE